MTLCYVERHHEEGSTSSSAGSCIVPQEVSKRRYSARTGFQPFTPSSHIMGCVSFLSTASQSSKMTPPGVPVSRHFDPLRSSPFDLSKFDRRDPYAHFYIPVDCPFARRCCDGTCPLAHTKLEKIFHPIVYKTQRCQMALTGRCQYLHKCAFFHTEEDKQEAELHWKAWEGEWISWRQHVDQLLLHHHKLEKEIRRKVEGIIKIRMSRSGAGALSGRFCGSSGCSTERKQQGEAVMKQNANDARSFSKEARMAAVWCSTTRGDKSVIRGTACFGVPESGTSGRKSEAPRKSLEKAMASRSCRQAIVQSGRGASRIHGSVLQAVDHQPNPYLHSEQGLYSLSSSAGRAPSAACGESSSGLYSSGFSARPLLNSVVLPDCSPALQPSYGTLDLQEFDAQHVFEVQLPTGPRYGQHAINYGGSEELKAQLAHQRAADFSIHESNDVYGSAFPTKGHFSVCSSIADTTDYRQRGTKSVNPTRTQHNADYSAPLPFVEFMAAPGENRGESDVLAAEGNVAEQAHEQVPKEQESTYSMCPNPLNFLYFQHQQLSEAHECNANVGRSTTLGHQKLASPTSGTAEKPPSNRYPKIGFSTESLTCWPCPESQLRGHENNRAGSLQFGGILGSKLELPNNWRSPTDTENAREPAGPSPQAITPEGHAASKEIFQQHGAVQAASEHENLAPSIFDSPQSSEWQQHPNRTTCTLEASFVPPCGLSSFRLPPGILAETPDAPCWSRQNPAGGRSLADLSFSTYSGHKDAFVSQQRLVAEGNNVPLSKADLHLLTRNLNQLLREAAEELERLEVAGISETTHSFEVWQISNKANAPENPIAKDPENISGGPVSCNHKQGEKNIPGFFAFPAEGASTTAHTVNSAGSSADLSAHTDTYQSEVEPPSL